MSKIMDYGFLFKNMPVSKQSSGVDSFGRFKVGNAGSKAVQSQLRAAGIDTNSKQYKRVMAEISKHPMATANIQGIKNLMKSYDSDGDFMSTTINTNYSSYFNVNNDTRDRIISEFKDASQEQKAQANASVEISMDGLKKYKESISPEKGVILSDQSTYNAMITDKMPSTYGEKDAEGNYSRIYYSPKQTADNMVKAYGEAMDEIVQGYKNGTRETYVEDKNSEGGIRKLTMEEELAELDKAFEVKTRQYEKEHDPKILNALKDHAKKVNELSSGQAKISKDGEKLVENAIKEMPKEFSKNVVKAANSFAEQYRLQMSGEVDISALLKGISII